MCGRYYFSAEQCAEIRQIADEINRKYGACAWHPGEIRPTMKAPVLLSGETGVTLELMSWGYRTAGPLIINARAETADKKPMFRESMTSRRCVIPSTGFFEWDDEKRKYFFTLPEEKTLYMAGLWTTREGTPCYTILTTAANSSMQPIHDRMPLILLPNQIQPWLMDATEAMKALSRTPPQLCRESQSAQLRLW